MKVLDFILGLFNPSEFTRCKMCRKRGRKSEMVEDLGHYYCDVDHRIRSWQRELW